MNDPAWRPLHLPVQLDVGTAHDLADVLERRLHALDFDTPLTVGQEDALRLWNGLRLAAEGRPQSDGTAADV